MLSKHLLEQLYNVRTLDHQGNDVETQVRKCHVVYVHIVVYRYTLITSTKPCLKCTWNDGRWTMQCHHRHGKGTFYVLVVGTKYNVSYLRFREPDASDSSKPIADWTAGTFGVAERFLLPSPSSLSVKARFRPANGTYSDDPAGSAETNIVRAVRPACQKKAPTIGAVRA
jgi:hypothetical protein